MLKTVYRTSLAVLPDAVSDPIRRVVGATYRAVAPVPAATPAPPVAQYGHFGDYGSFEAALADCTGYDTPDIAEAVARERERSIASGKSEIDERLVEVVAAVAVAISHLDKSTIRVLDYGAGNGFFFDVLQHYFPNISFDWSIVETQSMIDACKPLSSARWFTTIPDQDFDIALLSGVLQYMPDPYETLAKCASQASWMIVQRVPLGPEHRFTKQVVPPSIYSGSYPCSIFGREEFVRALESVGTIEMRWIIEKERATYADLNATGEGFLVKTRSAR